MHTDRFTSGTAGALVTPTGYDRFFGRSVLVARLLTTTTGRVSLPETVELPTDRPLLFAANHSSLFDLVASLVALGHFGLPARIGVNARFFINPAGRAFLRRLGCIPFDRDHREAAEESMTEALVARQACAIMPEGRITKPHERVDGVGPGRPGVSRIARLAGAAVVPVGIVGSDQVWPPGSARIRVGIRRDPVVVRFGRPMEFDTDDHSANTAELMAAISEACSSR
ncbi:MAG: lysophospholipid acyltransferase family protein [Acidimicrobiales bacterium]